MTASCLFNPFQGRLHFQPYMFESCNMMPDGRQCIDKWWQSAGHHYGHILASNISRKSQDLIPLRKRYQGTGKFMGIQYWPWFLGHFDTARCVMTCHTKRRMDVHMAHPSFVCTPILLSYQKKDGCIYGPFFLCIHTNPSFGMTTIRDIRSLFPWCRHRWFGNLCCSIYFLQDIGVEHMMVPLSIILVNCFRVL